MHKEVRTIWIGITLFLSIIACCRGVFAADAEQTESTQPMTVRDFIPRERRWGLDMAYTYSNRSSTENTATGLNSTSLDVLNVAATVRYGIARKIDLSTQLGFQASQTRSDDGTNTSSDSSSKFSNATVAVLYELVPDAATPALVTRATLTAVENVAENGLDARYGKGLGLMFGTYHVYDPIVMSASAMYDKTFTRRVEGRDVDPPDVFTVVTDLAFVPNSDSSVNAGFTWAYRSREAVDGVHHGIAMTTTNLNLGFAYEWSRITYVFLSLSSVVSGEGGASISFATNHRF